MKLGNAEIPDDLYVVLIENDMGINSDHKHRGEPMCWEHPLKHATLDAAIMVQRRLVGKYGATRIAKLTVIEE
jgi:hypothetical protein